MTERQARHIADAAVKNYRAQATLAESERLGQRQATRDNRAAAAEAERELTQAIEAVLE